MNIITVIQHKADYFTTCEKRNMRQLMGIETLIYVPVCCNLKYISRTQSLCFFPSSTFCLQSCTFNISHFWNSIFSAHWELKPSNGVIWCLQTAHHFHPCKLSHACTGIHVHKTHSSFKSDLRETRAYDSSSQQQIKTLQKTHLAVRRHHYLQKCIEWKPFSRGALSPRNLGGRRGLRMRGCFHARL